MVSAKPREFHPAFEEYCEAIWELNEDDISVIQARIAERLEVSRPAVSEMIRRMEQEKLITVDEVQYFQADNKYTKVVTRDGEALIRKSLKELVEALDAQQFWQIHRGTLVNAMAVAGVSRDFRGRLMVKLKDRSDTLQVSDSYAHLFKQM